MIESRGHAGCGFNLSTYQPGVCSDTYAHPQLYVDIGIIDYAFPRKQFYEFLHRLIDAGFENRIMFGSDEMVWPDAVSAAIDTIQDDPALTSGQKRDILYNNAARFLRIER